MRLDKMQPRRSYCDHRDQATHALLHLARGDEPRLSDEIPAEEPAPGPTNQADPAWPASLAQALRLRSPNHG